MWLRKLPRAWRKVMTAYCRDYGIQSPAQHQDQLQNPELVSSMGLLIKQKNSCETTNLTLLRLAFERTFAVDMRFNTSTMITAFSCRQRHTNIWDTSTTTGTQIHDAFHEKLISGDGKRRLENEESIAGLENSRTGREDVGVLSFFSDDVWFVNSSPAFFIARTTAKVTNYKGTWRCITNHQLLTITNTFKLYRLRFQCKYNTNDLRLRPAYSSKLLTVLACSLVLSKDGASHLISTSGLLTKRTHRYRCMRYKYATALITWIFL